MEREPTCYVIAGPNGAGKTTFAANYLPDVIGCRKFINADMIAAGLSPFAPEQASYTASKLLHEQLLLCIGQRKDFAFETTLSGRTYARTLRELRIQGWRIVLYYLWIPNASFSAFRVQQRVQEGGHNIPREAIARRFVKSIRNLFSLYIPLCDEVYCFNHSGPLPELVFQIVKDGLRVEDRNLFDQIRSHCHDSAT